MLSVSYCAAAVSVLGEAVFRDPVDELCMRHLGRHNARCRVRMIAKIINNANLRKRDEQASGRTKQGLASAMITRTTSFVSLECNLVLEVGGI